MQKDYISKNVEEILKTDFINFYKEYDPFWLEKSLDLYICMIRILKHISIQNNFNEFNTDLDYILNMYNELKEKRLLSVDEINIFEKYLESLSENVNEQSGIMFHYFKSKEERYIYFCRYIYEYLSSSNFLLDFFKLEREIKNF